MKKFNKILNLETVWRHLYVEICNELYIIVIVVALEMAIAFVVVVTFVFYLI